MNIRAELERLGESGNMRSLPANGCCSGIIDLTSNDYLGLASDIGAQQEFLERHASSQLQLMTASASRLLMLRQQSFSRLESLLESLYHRKALIFNSGYHANTGIIAAIAADKTLIVADKLVHASIIDGIRLSGAPFERFRHNNFDHLERILTKHSGDYETTLVIVESVYSLDGDSPDLERLLEIKRRYPRVMLYVDEAHAVGVCGPFGLGLAAATGRMDEFDIVVGTFGKALASSGAFCIVSDEVRQYLINRARSLIFSTALPPLSIEWTAAMIKKSLTMDSARSHLKSLASIFSESAGHIIPVITGSASRAVTLSAKLASEGFNVLPIRTPTVPPGTERLRISLSASLSVGNIQRFRSILNRLLNEA